MSSPSFDERRLSFGAAAAAYADHRPGYPTDALRWAWSAATRPVREVTEVGAGTGAMTRVLLSMGLDVTAFEPDDGMLDELGRRVPDVPRSLARAESLPVDDASADAVVAAQAWHWFDHERAAAEFARVVRPGGVIALVWNLRDTSVAWAAELARIIGGEDAMASLGSSAPSAPSAARPQRGADDYVRLGEQWSTPERAEFPHAVEMDADGLVALVSTFSYVRLRADADTVYAAVRDLVATHPDLHDRKTFALPYVTAVYRAVRL